MDVSLAIVTYNAADCLADCLRCLEKQRDHGGKLEILVVDGNSDDGTARIAASFSGVRVVQNPGRSIASNRNVALAEASHPFIAFTDSDCQPPPHWLAGLCRAWRELSGADEALAGVGGGNHPPRPGNQWEESLDIMLDSWLGSLGSVQGMRHDKPQKVTSIACLNALYERAKLLQAGGFDLGLKNMCEDADINYRLSRRGYTLYYAPGLDVVHNARDQKGPIAWFRKMTAYGRGRARLMRKHKSLFSPGLLLALGFWPALSLSALTAWFWPPALMVWLYFPAAWAYAFWIARRSGKAGLACKVALMLNLTHTAYGWGLLSGLAAKGKSARDQSR